MGIFEKLKGKSGMHEEKKVEQRTNIVSGIPFYAYKGKEPYMFISYSHRDSAVVYPILSEFYNDGYNIWYDEGIEPGIEWPEEIGKALGGCSLFVVFITPSAAGSPNVRNEINFALAKKIPFIAIHLTETELTPGLQLQIGSKQAILKYEMDSEFFKRKYTYSFEAVLKTPKQKVSPKERAFVEGERTPAQIDNTSFDEPAGKPVSKIESSAKPVPELKPSAPTGQEKSIPVPFVPGTFIADDFEWIGSKLVRYHGNKKEITIPSRASALFSYSFKDNPDIEKIIIPSSVSSIEFSAFENCPNLSLVIIEGGYVKIGYGNIPVASGCDKLSFQVHRNSLTQKELEKCFAGPVVFFPGENFEIEHGLLHKYYGNEKEVILPETVVIVGGFSFVGCKNLESVVMSDECGAILDDAFISCQQLKNITIGKSFSTLAKGAFKGSPYVRFSYYKGRIHEKFDQLFPDKSIVSEIDEAYPVSE